MSTRTASFHASPYLLLTLTAFFWSLNWVLGRAIVGHVSPLALTFIRWVVAVGVILNSAIPVMIIVLGWLFYRDTITRVQSLGVVVSLVGIAVIVGRGDPRILATLSMNHGDLIVLAGMVFWAAYTVFLRIKPVELPGLVLLVCCGSIGTCLLLPLFVLEMAGAFPWPGRVEVNAATLAAMLYVGIFPSFVGY